MGMSRFEGNATKQAKEDEMHFVFIPLSWCDWGTLLMDGGCSWISRHSDGWSGTSTM